MVAKHTITQIEVGEKSTVFFRGQLIDELDTPITAIDSALATVHAHDASNTVTKAEVDVNGATGGLFTATVAVSTITTQTEADVVIVTTTAHKLRTGDIVYLSGISGTDAGDLNTKTRKVEVIDPTSFSLVDEPGLYLSALTGGTVTIGVFELTLLTADTAIVGTVTQGHVQTHTLTLQIGYGTTKVLNLTREFSVYSIEQVS